MLNRKTILLFACLLCLFSAMAQQPSKITYAIKDADTLWMHHYVPTVKPNGITVLFVHGGSFTGGHPDNQKPFAEGLIKRGYNIFVTRYRLYLKGKSFGCETATPEKLKAIQTAVQDAADAANYLRLHAATLGVDTTRLFIAGSSAGAEAVLNLVFNPFKMDAKVGHQQFAGVLSFAGALLDINRYTNENRIPILLMHGTRDQLVPYATAAHRFCKANDAGWLMMFGSETIWQKAKKNKWPVRLYAFEGGGHEVSNYMFRKFDEMDVFMRTVVAQKKIKAKAVYQKKQN